MTNDTDTIDTDIVIAGGGLNGPALALALAAGGFRVTVVDARPPAARAEAGFDGRAYALAIGSTRLLDALGIWPALRDKAQPMMQIKASDGRAGQGPSPLHLIFDQAEIEEGPMGHMVEDRHLYAAFQSAMAANSAIDLISSDSVTGQKAGPDRITVTLASGAVIDARILVGCDGRGSGVATRAGIRRQGWDYGQTALVTAIGHAQDHAGVAHQFFMPEGPLAILPLKGGHHCSIVWSLQSQVAASLERLDDADFLSALVGDAAHGVHPIAGQGLNLGLRDVAALAEVLITAARRGEDIGAADVLERYQRWRRFDVTSLALGMDAVNRLFSNDNPLLRTARDAGMGLINALPGLRRGFIRQAAGLTGDLPRLMTGRPI